MKRAVAFILTMTAFVAVPAASQAAVMTLGSDLSAPANSAEAHGADSVFWSPGTRMPAYGQVTTIRIKGVMATTPGAPAPFTGGSGNFSALSPGSGGSVIVRQRSQPVDLPAGGDPEQVSTFQPEHLCVRTGEYVGFTNYGGFNPQFYPNGVPFQMFSQVPGANTRFYTKDRGTGDGARLSGTDHPGQELLMQIVLATGANVGPLCPRGPGKFGGVRIHRRLSDAFLRGGFARIRTTCPASGGLCSGRMRVTTAEKKRKKRKLLGSTKFALGPGNTRDVRVPLTPLGKRLIGRRNRLKAIVGASVRDRLGRLKKSKGTIRLKALRR